jgi:hypothetical protein
MVHKNDTWNTIFDLFCIRQEQCNTTMTSLTLPLQQGTWVLYISAMYSWVLNWDIVTDLRKVIDILHTVCYRGGLLDELQELNFRRQLMQLQINMYYELFFPHLIIPLVCSSKYNWLVSVSCKLVFFRKSFRTPFIVSPFCMSATWIHIICLQAICVSHNSDMHELRCGHHLYMIYC